MNNTQNTPTTSGFEDQVVDCPECGVRREGFDGCHNPDCSEFDEDARMARKTPTLDDDRSMLNLWVQQAKTAIPEKDAVIDALILCAIAMTNMILYGKPGTAKSLVARAFGSAIVGKVFDILMTRYTSPNEINGPTDVQALKQGHNRRRTRGYLPEADVAFLDEGFKANSACLNSLLTAVNEHKFHDDGVPVDIPLRVAVLASNEFPEDNDNLGAFDDRFPMRFDVRRLQNRDNFAAMINHDLPKITAPIDVRAIDRLGAHAETLRIDDGAVDALWDLSRKLEEAGIYASDRKLDACGRLLRARAALVGSPKVTTAHLGLLEHCLWVRPDDKAAVRELVAAHVATWLRDLRSSIEVIDEQEAAMAQAVKKQGDTTTTANAIAKVGAKLKALKKEVLADLKHVPEAKADVERLEKRIEKINARGRKALAVLI